MTEVNISNEDFKGLKDKVVVITGASSGIGLSTANILLSQGAKIVNGDLNPPPSESSTSTSTSKDFVFQRTDVTEWKDLNALFKKAISEFGRIDHVFANAGMTPLASYTDLELDDEGEPKEPTFRTVDVNLRGVMNTAALGIHYLKKQKESGGSIVLTASSSCFSRFRAGDYAIAKHGTLGLLRSLTPVTPSLNIRVNCLCPSWTITGLVPQELAADNGTVWQNADAPAKAAVYLMAEKDRHGQMILSVGNKYREIEDGVLLKAMTSEVRGQKLSEDEVLCGVLEAMTQQTEEKQ